MGLRVCSARDLRPSKDDDVLTSIRKMEAMIEDRKMKEATR